MKLRLLFQGGKVNAELARVHGLEKDGHVVALIGLLDSEVRGLTKYSIVRGHVAAALGRLGDPRAVPYLIEKLHDPEDIVRLQAAEALSRLKTKQAEDALREALSNSAPVVRMSAADALGRIGAVDDIPLLRSASESDPDPEVRLSAIESLVILGDTSARERVPEALRAISPLQRLHPRNKRLQEIAESGEPLTPWVRGWE